MFTTNRRTAVNRLLARLLTAVAVATAGIALIGPAAASAKPKGPLPQGCPVEDENGNVTYVAPGTHYLLFTCGEDGQWHWGWLLAASRRPTPPSSGPVVLAGGVLRLEAHDASRLPLTT